MAIKSNKFFNLSNELTTQGTLDGHKLSNAERIEAFKKRKDPIKFKTFVEKLLDKKESAAPLESLPAPKKPKALLPEGDTPAKRMREAFDKRLDDLLESINKNVGGILAVIEKRADTEEDSSDELKQEKEKDKRAKGEEKKEKSKAKAPAMPGFVKKLTAPVAGWWETILKGFTMLLAGWGIDKLFKWLGNPANAQAVEDLREFIVVTLPPILKGILALVALDIGLKVFAFVKMLALGSVKLLLGLKSLFVKTMAALAANPWLAAALGIAAIGAGAMYMGSRQKQQRQADNERDDDSTLTVDEFSQQEDKSKVNVPLSQAYGETGTFPGMMNFNQGGFVSGPDGKDRVPAKLTAGEFVMSKGAVEKYGTDTLEGMNAAGGGKNNGSPLRGYNEGGKVERTNQGGGLLGRTGKVGFIGDDRKVNRFPGPKKEMYFLQVQKNNGNIEIWNEEFGSDKYIGTMDPKTKNIQFNQKWWGGAKPFEVAFFSQQKNKQMVAAQANKLIKQAASAKEITKKKADQLMSNPPGSGGGSMSDGGVNIGGGSQGGGQEGPDSGTQPLFSPIDTSNLSSLTTKALYSILQ
jgi:uncharacterized membrane protein YgcG